MSEVEIKQEFDENFVSQCRSCLSVGRTLKPLGKHSIIYQKLISDLHHLDIWNQLQVDHVYVCWECYWFLHKVSKFQEKLIRANETFLLGHNFVSVTLSTLTTVIFNDSHKHTIYINEQTNIQTKTESQELIINQDDFDDDMLQDDETQDISEVLKQETKINVQEIEEQKNKIKTVSRWAQKRAKENKKPKYKIITSKNKIEKIFFKIILDRKGVKSRNVRKIEGNMSDIYGCDTCGINFGLEMDLLNHNANIHNEKLYICDICTKLFRSKRHLSTHIKTHYFEYKCSVCGYSCSSEMFIKKHVRKKHKQVIECLKCGMKFGTINAFHEHHKEWHEKFICDHCGVSFKMRYCIKEHIKKQHRKFKCSQCNKQFARYNGLWLHNKTQHATSATTAYCVECDKRFPDIYRYRWHLANSVKHKQKPKKKIKVPCPECEKVFSKNIYMKDHYNLVHLKQYKYRCEECDKNFLRNADLVKHHRRVHEGILPPKNKICYMCGRGFSSNKLLSQHIRTHTGERPHVCARCPAAFTQRAALAAHLRSLHHT